MRQIALPLDWPAARASFIVTPSNARAARLLEDWADWPVMTALLTGPPRSGRSLLARLFAARSGGTVIEAARGGGAGGIGDAALFHAWNRAEAERRPLVIVADEMPTDRRVALPDLRSRLALSPHAAISPPDDALVRALLEAGFLARGLDARPGLIDWLVARLERSHAGVEKAIERLALDAMERRCRLSIAQARATLTEARLLALAPSGSAGAAVPEDR